MIQIMSINFHELFMICFLRMLSCLFYIKSVSKCLILLFFTKIKLNFSKCEFLLILSLPALLMDIIVLDVFDFGHFSLIICFVFVYIIELMFVKQGPLGLQKLSST